MQLEEKVAIISGGGSGIGRGIALALAREGTRVVVFGRRKASLDETLEIARSQGGEGLAVEADGTRVEDVDRVIGQTLAQYGQIDILVNNAGVGGFGSLHEISPETWDHIMATNLRGPFLMARAVLPYMRAQRSGHIFNISSESGLEYYEGDGAYGTSKHALNALGEYIQRENQEFNIRVNTICPGMVVSEMTDNSPGLDPQKCLYPEDIADLVVWLLKRRENVKIGRPILIQTMLNPWE
jgi:3-oxoacyl-[acyl-carrier protein] reductase